MSVESRMFDGDLRDRSSLSGQKHVTSPIDELGKALTYSDDKIHRKVYLHPYVRGATTSSIKLKKTLISVCDAVNFPSLFTSFFYKRKYSTSFL